MTGRFKNINRCCRTRLEEVIAIIDEAKKRSVILATSKIGDQLEVTALLGGIRTLEELKRFLVNEMTSEEDERALREP